MDCASNIEKTHHASLFNQIRQTEGFYNDDLHLPGILL